MGGWELKWVVGWLGTKKFLIYIGYAVTRLRGYAYVIVCLITPFFYVQAGIQSDNTVCDSNYKWHFSDQC